jgi:hypothetical protein
MGEELGGIALVPLIVGLVEMTKRLGLGAAWAAPLAVGLGLLASVGWAVALGPGSTPPSEALARAALMGIALGLSASGLYSGLKHARGV